MESLQPGQLMSRLIQTATARRPAAQHRRGHRDSQCCTYLAHGAEQRRCAACLVPWNRRKSRGLHAHHVERHEHTAQQHQPTDPPQVGLQPDQQKQRRGQRQTCRADNQVAPRPEPPVNAAGHLDRRGSGRWVAEMWRVQIREPTTRGFAAGRSATETPGRTDRRRTRMRPGSECGTAAARTAADPVMARRLAARRRSGARSRRCLRRLSQRQSVSSSRTVPLRTARTGLPPARHPKK